jgi:hypothetical protein
MTRPKTTPTALALGAILAWMAAAPMAAEAQRAVPRERSADGDSGGSGGGQAVPRGGSSPSGGDSTAGRSSGDRSSGGATVGRPAGGGAAVQAPQTDSSDGAARRQVPPYSRPRGENNPTGDAVARRGVAPPRGGAVVVPGDFYGGFYPLGYGGFGLGGYYGGYYDPWYYGGSGYFPQYYYGDTYTGALRLKVKPRDASVFVDGYYSGRVDDFDGMFQRLRIETGPHRIEIRAEGYEPLTFEVRILPDRTITYEGELKPLP